MEERLLEKVKKRLPEVLLSDEVLVDYIDTISCRLCLRLGTEMLPEIFGSICVDAVIKMYRRTYYEGISAEASANVSTTFVDDLLAEYEQEIEDWKARQGNAGSSGRVVRFL